MIFKNGNKSVMCLFIFSKVIFSKARFLLKHSGAKCHKSSSPLFLSFQIKHSSSASQQFSSTFELLHFHSLSFAKYHD